MAGNPTGSLAGVLGWLACLLLARSLPIALSWLGLLRAQGHSSQRDCSKVSNQDAKNRNASYDLDKEAPECYFFWFGQSVKSAQTEEEVN